MLPTARRTRRKIRVSAPLWALGMAAAGQEWMGFRMPQWRDSVAQAQSRAFESTIRELYKVGKADLNRVTQISGQPTRLHQQVRKLEAQFGKGNVSGEVVEELGETTTAAAKAAETARLRDIVDATGKVPAGNVKSFKP